MDDTGSFQQMLSSLRQSFTARLPAGLSPPADARLQRTLGHFIREIVRVQGTMNEQEILRETFDSMAGWFRRNTSQLSPVFRQGAEEPRIPSPTMVEAAVAPDMGLGAFAGIGAQPWIDTHEDPLDMFERLKLTRQQLGGLPPIPPPAQGLQAIETRFQRQPVQAKDLLQAQEPVVKYRDTEHNLVLNSRDRDWLHSAPSQNRYNFSVHLDTTRPQGSSTQLTLMTRLRNIVRIEFVKAILPVEALEVVVPRCTVPAENFYSVLALPYVSILLDEYQGNNVGTNDIIDRSLAICQYDATWRTDNYHSRTNTNRGFTLFFPKFMKAQRIYAPTPLSNFQRLSFQILGPENLPLSAAPDSSQVQRVAWGFDISGSCYADPSGEYLFIQTGEHFPACSYSQLDKVIFDGMTFTSNDVDRTKAGAAAIEWIQRTDGHIVVGVAHMKQNDISGMAFVGDGPNACGYADWIIVRNRFSDPTKGECTVEYFTEGHDFNSEEALAKEFFNYPAQLQAGGILNLSRQVQLTLRVITRDLDSATNIRPDNV